MGVYHANGGVIGELAYVFGKLFGLTECALCNISHGYVREKPSMRAWRSALPIQFEFAHLNELDAVTREFVAGRTPCILFKSSKTWSMLIDKDALSAMDGDEAILFAEVERHLESKMPIV